MNAKWLVVLIPLLMLLGMATAVTALEARRTPDWQAALYRYIATQPASVQRVVRARHPDQFTPEMGYPASDDWQWQVERLPHPPHDLYCALLRTPGAPSLADDARHRVVYIGYLTDSLYRVGWLVYAGPRSPFPAELTDQLAALGCDLAIPAY